ncbi:MULTISPECIES: imidazole glycerol phosphate synthase subunit HisH [Chryseobacterium]|uniref:imidazole glycerol phosphate synthase subunit HisH n=1 Tax=Chryseobacterium TaxID=59732 RepID=UPI0011166385|nr:MULTISPECIES: imidazole glycerol phosphate synthase subunit HisH [Chryseobacterium]
MITILNYGVGNIQTFINIYKKLGISCNIAKDEGQLKKAEKIILPGVGHFDFAMKKLQESGMVESLNLLVLDSKLPILGVCVGMQMMTTSSEEGERRGLDWVSGEVLKMKNNAKERSYVLPHLGWNTINIIKESPVLNNLDEKDFYFLHSYYVKCSNVENSIATTSYGEEFTSVIQKDNIFGIQCYPEKSHQAGIQFLENFAKI